MTTKQTLIGEIGADYAYKGTKTQATFSSHGVKWVGRYITRGNNTKVLTPAERDQLFAWGISIMLIWETSANAINGGYAAGLADGHDAAKAAIALYYSRSACIMAAVDTDVYYANAKLCQQYLRGFYDGLAGQFPLGLYGDVDAYQTSADIVSVWCHPNAWKSAAIKAGIYPYGLNIMQGRQDLTIGWDFPNTCSRVFTVWSGLGADTPPPVNTLPPPPIVNPAPPPEGTTMTVIVQALIPGDPTNACYPAVFYGEMDSKGLIVSVIWSGKGDPNTASGQKVLARYKAYTDRGVQTLKITRGDFANINLIGNLPPDWAASEFAPNS